MTLFDKERLYIKWKYLYYNGQTEVSDEIFDKLEDELRTHGSDVVNIPDCPNIETLVKYNLLDELTVGEKGIRFKHVYPMLSLKKYQVKIENEKEIFPIDIVNFFNKVPGGEVTCTPKFDGNSMELIFIRNNDVFVLNQSLTRGNEDLGGGLDKTDKIKHIVPNIIVPNLYHKDYDKIVIRGEVIIPTKIWETKWSDPNKVDNPRNWLAGVLNSDDINIDAIKDMHFVAYQIACIKGDKIDRFTDQLEYLQMYGFKSIFSITTNGYDDFFNLVYPKFKQYRQTCEYALDGIVLNFSPEHWDNLGENSHHPHYACAVKFPPNRVITVLNGITWKLGKDGEYTPIADLEPVILDGTIVKHASMHNLGWIVDNHVFPGCVVEIAKKGEIIPQLIRIVEKSPYEKEYQEYLNNFIKQHQKQ